MKVAVSSTGPDINSQVDPRFGRCQYFLIVETDTMHAEAIQNTAAMASGGAGIQAAQMVAQRGAQAVLTGSLGPNATQALAAAGLEVALGTSGTVKEAVEQFKSGNVQAEKPTASPTGQSIGMGMGGGYGLGRGRGGGRGGVRGTGMRRYVGAGLDPQFSQASQTRLTSSSDLEDLKNMVSKLQEQIQRIERRLDEIQD